MTIKKLGLFTLIAIVTFIVTIAVVHSRQIWEAIKSFPIDWVISFFVGAFAMFIPSYLLGGQDSETSSKTDDEE